MPKIILVLIFCTISYAPARASDDLWVGAWKIDPATSYFIGTTFLYSQCSDGMYHYSEGRKSTYTSFRIDGREYKTKGASTSTCTAVGNSAWDTVHKTSGIVLEQVHRQRSSDGNTFDLPIGGSRPDGARFHHSLAYRRLNAGKGLLGKWISTKVDTSIPDTVVFLPSPPGTYHWEAPTYKVAIEGRLDGPDIPVTDLLVSPGSITTFRQITPRRILYILKLEGRVESVGVQTLVRDGKLFTNPFLDSQERAERSTSFYVRQ